MNPFIQRTLSTAELLRARTMCDECVMGMRCRGNPTAIFRSMPSNGYSQAWPLGASLPRHRDVFDSLEFDNAVGTQTCVIHHPPWHRERSSGWKNRPAPSRFVGTGNQEQLRPVLDEVTPSLVVVPLSGPLQLIKRVWKNESQPRPERRTNCVADRFDAQSSLRSGRPNRYSTA